MRQLTAAMQSALTDGKRQPAYKLYAFDPTVDTISAVASGSYTQTPFDLTPYASDITWTPAQLSFTLQDPQAIFHPDFGAQKNYLVDGAIIRLLEGDARVAQSDWPNSFTGQIHGQIGWQGTRESRVLQAKVTAFSRDNNQALKRRLITTEAYSLGTDLGNILYDIAENFLGLTAAEIRIAQTLGFQTLFQTTQISQVCPWDAITTILEAIGQVPCFDGDGRLTAYSKNMHRDPNRILTDLTGVFDCQVPENNMDIYNRIKVTFLSSTLSKSEGSDQKLGSAQVTTGFFSFGETLKCWWSDDHTQRAENTRLKVIKSVNAGLLPVGTEKYEQVDDFHGVITITIDVWVAGLATLMIAEYLAAAWIPDDVTVGLFEGITIPVGRAAEAQALVCILLIMMSLGSAQYEVWGTPFDYCYQEQWSIATEDGLSYWEQNQKEIKNDLLGSYDRADYVALTELTWEKAAGYPRQMSISDDLALELGDIVELPDGRKFCITDMSKSIKRGEIPVLTLKGVKVVTA